MIHIYIYIYLCIYIHQERREPCSQGLGEIKKGGSQCERIGEGGVRQTWCGGDFGVLGREVVHRDGRLLNLRRGVYGSLHLHEVLSVRLLELSRY